MNQRTDFEIRILGTCNKNLMTKVDRIEYTKSSCLTYDELDS